ncbi:PadR family transcriptional regulator [Kitasatospora sp. McL0602]|uniref:PadR family transcriptional regulator n=1 Tax=Kitasatospora sp. McL0602 TaxID=3439530 RepID=UPI003F8A0B46
MYPPYPPPPPLPPPPPEPWSHGGAHRHRTRTPDVRAAALLLLAERPVSGYQIVRELDRRSQGMWRPSAGSVYPALQLLEDEGLAQASGAKGSRTFHLTEDGEQYVEANRAALGTPWEEWISGPDQQLTELRGQLAQLVAAVEQVATAAEPAQIEQAGRTLARTRRELYLMLAGAEPTDQPSP